MVGSERSRDTAAREALRAWYRPRRRAYPWRRAPRSAYAVLVSEVMLQQTQAARVADAYGRFMRRFPTVEALSASSRADVLRAWAGLGYNRRAVALHETCRRIVDEHGGRVPSVVTELMRLPGVGPYTAAAVASLAFGVPVAAIDTNVRRIVARVRFGADPDELDPARVQAESEAWLDSTDPGAWNSALMDLGRELCRPRDPRCDECPVASACRYRAAERRGTRSLSRQEPFEGSNRQLRGAVVAILRERASASPAQLAAITGESPDRVAGVEASLVRDGVVEIPARRRVTLAS